MPSHKRASEGYTGHAVAEEAIIHTREERGRGNGHSAATQKDVVQLLAAILNQVRNESILRPPPLSKAAEAAIESYGIMSSALNPPRSELLRNVIE